MGFNGSGQFIRSFSWATDASNGVAITASRMDTEDNGFATGLSNCVTRDGQSPALANLPMGGYKITGLGDGSGVADATTIGQLASTSGGTGAGLVGYKQALTGSVARTVAAKASELVSVKDFGALGDGATDDAAAIRLAVTAAGILGWTVYFP
ncbi:MAG: hypothetical protein JF605_23335, partial [Burkholderia sp.]|nr:hypothetical protein [Burkholderia sp.]